MGWQACLHLSALKWRWSVESWSLQHATVQHCSATFAHMPCLCPCPKHQLPCAAHSLPQRRLILGAVAAVGLGAFALVPTGELQLSKPSKPLFFYLVPLMRCGRGHGSGGQSACCAMGWQRKLSC